MEFTVKNSTKELTFNIGFMRKLDARYSVIQNGLAIGAGLGVALPQLENGSVTMLADVIAAAWPGNPSQAIIDDAIDKYAEENGSLETLFDEVLASLKASPTIKATIEKIEANMNGL